ncbi:hypothetical protein [uncultured Kordia sp.]|nr:hypothetical protein [uncultured Kordia sp.]
MQLLESKEQFQLLFDPTTDRHVVFDAAIGHLHYTTSLKDAESFFKQKVQ